MKKKTFVASLIFAGFISLILVGSSSAEPAGPSTPTVKAQNGGTGNYKLLEGLPGIFNPEQSVSLNTYVSGIYKFGIWTVGIAAAFMLMIGGFLYLTSAGNTSNAGTAKGLIQDALLGLVVAMCAYLLLYVINPDLVNLGRSFEAVALRTVDESDWTVQGSGACQPVSTGHCSQDTMRQFFINHKGDTSQISADDWARQASGICVKESKGGKNPGIKSEVDNCMGSGKPESVSIGLFQINISVHPVGNNCNKAFNTGYGSKYKGEPKEIFAKRCRITDEEHYKSCVQLMSQPTANMEAMWRIYTSGRKYSWRQWGANSACKFK